MRSASNSARQEVTPDRRLSSARRSRSVLPPQTPNSVWLSSASARHSAITGQLKQTCLATCWAAPRTNRASGSTAIQDPCNAHCSTQVKWPVETSSRYVMVSDMLVSPEKSVSCGVPDKVARLMLKTIWRVGFGGYDALGELWAIKVTSHIPSLRTIR